MWTVQWWRDSYQGYPPPLTAPPLRRHHRPLFSPCLLASSYTARARTSSCKGCCAYPDSTFLFCSDSFVLIFILSASRSAQTPWSGGSYEKGSVHGFREADSISLLLSENSIEAEWVKHKFHGLRKFHRFFRTHLKNRFSRWHFRYTLTQTQKCIFALFTEGTSLNHCLVRNRLYWDINSFH